MNQSAAENSDCLVSIVLPVHNGEVYLRESVDSILKQTLSDWELIIIDDASTDSTAQICDEFVERDPRIRYFRNEQNSDISASLNRGFSLARGKFLTWTSDDNIYHHEALKKMTDAAIATESNFVYAINQTIDSQGNFLPSFFGAEKESILKTGKNLFGACFLYSRQIAVKVDGYRTAMPRCEDFDYFLRLSSICKTKFLPEVLYYYRVHPAACSSANYLKRLESLSKLYAAHPEIKGRQAIYDQILAFLRKQQGYKHPWMVIKLMARYPGFIIYALHVILRKAGGFLPSLLIFLDAFSP